MPACWAMKLKSPAPASASFCTRPARSAWMRSRMAVSSVSQSARSSALLSTPATSAAPWLDGLE
jgi:hypothetical protein